jgi:hypothetical protein
MKAYFGNGSIPPHILDLDNGWIWAVSFTPRPLYPQGKSPGYPLDRRLGGPHSQSGRSDEEKNSQSLPGLELPIIQHVAQRYTTELSRLFSVKNVNIKIYKTVIFLREGQRLRIF